MTQHRVTALVGAQFGSEGKGLIAEKLARNYHIHVRTGAPNAGHTYFVTTFCDHKDVEWAEHYEEREYPSPVPTHHRCLRCGNTFPNIADETEWMPQHYRAKVVARSVPCGASNPDAMLIIGVGGLIDIELLLEEVRELDALGLNVSSRLMVDSKACVIDPIRHHGLEGGVDGEAHRLIGSTGEGVGPARMAKIARGTFRDWAWAKIDQVGGTIHEDRLVTAGVRVGDTAHLLNTWYDVGRSILLEGTQGSGLSLVHGPWPYCTSTDTNAGQLAVDAGLAPQLITDVILVARTMPIRVAGNSGPLPGETSWEKIGLPEERTTVTKKVRRIAYWSDALVRRAIMLNRPSEIALTFVDYLFSEMAGLSGDAEISKEAAPYLRDLEKRMGVGITMLGTGPDTVVFNNGHYRTPSGVFLNRDDTEPEPLTWPVDWAAYGIDPLEAVR